MGLKDDNELVSAHALKQSTLVLHSKPKQLLAASHKSVYGLDGRT